MDHNLDFFFLDRSNVARSLQKLFQVEEIESHNLYDPKISQTTFIRILILTEASHKFPNEIKMKSKKKRQNYYCGEVFFDFRSKYSLVFLNQNKIKPIEKEKQKSFNANKDSIKQEQIELARKLSISLQSLIQSDLLDENRHFFSLSLMRLKLEMSFTGSFDRSNLLILVQSFYTTPSHLNPSAGVVAIEIDKQKSIG